MFLRRGKYEAQFACSDGCYCGSRLRDSLLHGGSPHKQPATEQVAGCLRHRQHVHPDSQGAQARQ